MHLFTHHEFHTTGLAWRAPPAARAQVVDGDSRRDQNSKPDQNPTFSAGVKVVNLFATVRDKQGAIVKDLTKDDFILDEDGRPQVIRYFAQESNLPLTVGLLVDTSGSTRRVLPDERMAAYRFPGADLARQRPGHGLPDPLRFRGGTFAGFDLHRGRSWKMLWTSFRLRTATAVFVAAARAAEGIPAAVTRAAGSGAAAVPACTIRYCWLPTTILKKQAGRKAVILLTDGEDNGSKVSLSRAVESAANTN